MLLAPRGLVANAWTCAAALGRQGGRGRRRGEVQRADPGQGGQHGQQPAHHRVGAGEVGLVGVLVRAGGVEQHHPGDLRRVAGGVGHGERAAGGVPGQDVRAVLAGAGQQGVQVGGDGDAVLRVGDVVAPALTGPVVRADPGGAGDLRGDAAPQRRGLAQAVLEHDGGAAGAGAVQVQAVPAHVVEAPGIGYRPWSRASATLSTVPPTAVTATTPMTG